MKNQIIKKNVDSFESFVKENFAFEKDYYIFNHVVFKKLEYENKIYPFLEELKDYYSKTLQFRPLQNIFFGTIL